MAGVTMYANECAGHCACSMWEESGIQYRSNLLRLDGVKTVALHSHSYDHTARIKGLMRMSVNGIDSEVCNEDVFIPAWQQHTFTLIEGGSGVGEVLCFWRSE